ncbi:hypothetical protein [Leifsonia sp. AG29]|uniref:hypothetical protein n=1 Tax=Leifsonia sp. AG29 TaxID=2598860 RepID=UPI00131DC2F8|nr:hypothetical protein [Leifsonia sp. AG29]
MTAPRHRRLAVVSLSAVLLLGAAPALAGCSFQSAVKDLTGGNVNIGGASVPSDFPSAVPLTKGSVILGASVGSPEHEVWNVTVKVSGPEAADSIQKQLADAKFAGGFQTQDQGSAGTFTNGTYGVLVVVTDSGHNGWVANYSVTKGEAPSSTATSTP